ncbi:MAG: hypothetical protein Q8O40_17835, partial [Chloroflexota bacterium]|nr:hypothetical protein [Chloroflexota bacterium]
YPGLQTTEREMKALLAHEVGHIRAHQRGLRRSEAGAVLLGLEPAWAWGVLGEYLRLHLRPGWRG